MSSAEVLEILRVTSEAKENVVIFSKACYRKQELLDNLGYKEVSLPFKYLGIPIVGKELRAVDCGPLIN